MTTTIDRDVLTVLSDCSVKGSLVHLPPGRLDRKLYLRVNAVLEALGGKWNRKSRGHLFESDPAGALDDCILTGSYVKPKDEFGFFPTPAAVADVVAELADLRSGHRVLEPSAGTGALVEASLRVCSTLRLSGVQFACVEIQPELAAKLNRFDCTVVAGDFLAQRAEALGVRTSFDRVVMNPPFSRGQDVLHVTHAFEFLKPGGRLVSVMSAGVEFRRDKRYAEFRERFSPELTRLPENSFRESGTNVSTVIAVIDK